MSKKPKEKAAPADAPPLDAPAIPAVERAAEDRPSWPETEAAAAAPAPPPVLPPTPYDWKMQIYLLEKAAKGHGADADRELMRDTAQMLRRELGLTADAPVGPVPGPYAPVDNKPPIGHSLPPTKK